MIARWVSMDFHWLLQVSLSLTTESGILLVCGCLENRSSIIVGDTLLLQKDHQISVSIEDFKKSREWSVICAALSKDLVGVIESPSTTCTAKNTVVCLNFQNTREF